MKIYRILNLVRVGKLECDDGTDKILSLISENTEDVSEPRSTSGDLHAGYQMECEAVRNTGDSGSVAKPLPKRSETKEVCEHPRSNRISIGSGYLRCTLCGQEFK